MGREMLVIVEQCSVQFPPNTSLRFTASVMPGSYTYFCTIHPGSMFGTFTVLASSTSGAGGGVRLYEK